VLTDAIADDVSVLCTRLDGLPLAIELAAARLSHLTVPSLLFRVASDDGSLSALSRGAVDLPLRHRSLRDTIEWSYGLLGTDERRLLRRLGVFETAATLDAIEAVCGVESTCEDQEAVLENGTPVLDALAALVDLHLVEPEQTLAGPARFTMLTTIRAFARSQLVEEGERDDIEARHTRLYVELSADLHDHPARVDAVGWLERLDREVPELRAALRRALGARAAEDAARLVDALGGFWLYRGHVNEGLRWIAEVDALAQAVDVAPARRADVLLWTAMLASDRGEIGGHVRASATLDAVERAVALARAGSDRASELRAIYVLAHVLTLNEDTTRAEQVTADGLALAADDEWWRGQFLHRAAWLAQHGGDFATAMSITLEGNELARRVGDRQLLLDTSFTLAQVAPLAGRDDLAPPLDQVLEMARSLGRRRTECQVLASLGAVALSAGDVDEAARIYHDGLSLSRDAGYWHGLGFCTLGAIAVAALRRDNRLAARMHGAAEEQLDVLRRGMPPDYWDLYQQLLAGARDAMGREFAREVDLGRATSFETAVALALESTSPPRDRAAARDSDTAGAHDAELTPREREVLALMAEGRTNKEIGGALFLSAKTVMHHSMSIYRKLGVRGRAEATAVAVRTGLVPASKH
jgi:DNA-binding CsgD family transcriptional regulator